MEPLPKSTGYETISVALTWLVEHQQRQPSLAELAGQLQLSESHVQKTFQRFVGVSPKQFLKLLTREQAIKRLKRGQTVLESALSSGLTGPGRLHDLLISTDALTPGQARKKGKGVQLFWGIGDSPFGQALIAWNSRGVTFLAFCQPDAEQGCFQQLNAQWPDASYQQDNPLARRYLQKVFERQPGEALEIWLRGSPFQLKVWQALLAIAPATHASYADIAQAIGQPAAARAAGTAIGKNPVAWLIPCHRVITSQGGWGGYRWGLNVKQAMAGVEAAACERVNS